MEYFKKLCLSFIASFIASLVLIDNSGIGTLGEWLGVIIASSTLFLALKIRTDKSDINIYASYVRYSKDFEDGEMDRHIFKVYGVNTKQTAGLVKSWGIILSGEKIEISNEPCIVKGFDVKEIFISRSEWEPENNTYFDNDRIMKKVRESTAELNEFRVYLVEAKGVEKECKVIIEKN